jgi:hypothetical protein
MLLHDIGKSPDNTFRRINRHLETNYGFKISEDVSDKDLVSIMEQLEEEITDLKVKGDDARSSSEISKRLLVLEGIRNLREYAMMQIGQPDNSHHQEKVLGFLIDFIVEDFAKCGDFEESVRDAMKQYRSSKYRFPDDTIEQQARSGASMRIRAESPTADLSMDAAPMMEDDSEDEASGDSENNGIEEMADPFSNVMKRSGGSGGHAGEVPDTAAGRRAMNMLNKPGLSIQDKEKDTEQVPMVRNKEGKMVPDPFAAQSAERRKGIYVHETKTNNTSKKQKGIAMKEHANLVKNLRRLLETEVSQAEVMMAAKGFAQELQEMVEKIGRLQNEDLPPVTDQMRETYGMESASAFQTQIYGALQSVMDALYTAKQQVDDAVGNMASTGQVTAQTDMDIPVDGMDDGMDAGMDGMDADLGDEEDLDNIGADLDMDDEFGGEEALGRSKKMESTLQRKVMEMQRLVAKVKKLKESQN